MSSHHVVRDEQEPALIIANGASCSIELMGQLLEWSPTVMVLDGAIERVMSLGIKMDIVLGDFDRVDPYQIPDIQDQVKIVHAPDQEFSDLEKGIRYFIDQGYYAVNIVWATGNRMDHVVANLSVLAKWCDDIKIVMWDDYSRIYPLPKSFEKWYAGGTTLSLMPIGLCRGVKTTGLKYNLDEKDLELGKYISISNETLSDGIVRVAYKEGKLLMMECHD